MSWHGRGKSIRLVDPTSNREFVPIMLLEYSRVFPGKTIVLDEEIKHFSREMLVKMVLVLGKNTDNALFPTCQTNHFSLIHRNTQRNESKVLCRMTHKNQDNPRALDAKCLLRAIDAVAG